MFSSPRIKDVLVTIATVLAFVGLFALLGVAGLVMNPTDITGPPRP